MFAVFQLESSDVHDRDDLQKSNHYLAQLHTFSNIADPETSLEINVVEVECLIRRGDLETAWRILGRYLRAQKNNRNLGE